jgi:dihydrofolate synthase/folylpolyglutamate synthase
MDYSPEFRDVLDRIYSYTVNGRKSKKLQTVPIPLTLDVMHLLMAYLDHPEQQYPVIHIAGTKGKGSTANLIANTLVSAGYRVGLFTSPHLHDFSERIQVNGKLIPHTAVTELVRSMEPFFLLHPEINTFEIITAIAFDFFCKEKIDIAVVEVGLGGRFDATNVVSPLLSVITSISFDHMDLLGDSLEEIAFEKAGIIKPSVPVVIGKQPLEARDVLLRAAEERDSPIVNALSYTVTGEIQTSFQGHQFTISRSNEHPLKLTIPLLGYHQIENATIAFAALRALVKLGLPIPDDAIQIGFSTVYWPARFEIISRKPLIVIDGAHNVDSIVRVLETLRIVMPEKKIHVIFGVSIGKDAKGMLNALLPVTSSILFSRSTHPKSISTEALVQLSNELGYQSNALDTVEEALEKKVKKLGDEDVLLCTGSLFIAAAVRDIWKNTRKNE